MLPEGIVRKEGGISGETAFEVIANLALQLGPFGHQITSMSRHEMEGLIKFAEWMLDQSEAIHGGAEDGDQVMVVGLDVAMFGESIMVGCERMNKSGIESSTAEGSRGNLMVGGGHFDTDNQVQNGMGLDGLLELKCGRLKITVPVLNRGGRNEDATIKITQHPLEAILGAVDADDSKVLGSDLLNSGLDDASGLTQNRLVKCFRPLTGLLFAGFNCCSHDNRLSGKKRFYKHFPQKQLKQFF